MTQHPLLEFGEHMMESNDPIECGETWAAHHGWRTYMRVGTKAAVMTPRAMRKLGEKYRDHPDAPPEVRSLGEIMIECSNAAKMKNDRGEVPDGAVTMIPHVGTA